MTLLPSLALGFALGVRHATDADHIAAVGTIASGGRGIRHTALVGAWWGLGHSASVLVVGGVLVLLELPMPTRVALAFEFGVAVMLVVLGLRSLVTRPGHTPTSALRPLLVGVMHGLAGAAVLALIIIAMTDSGMAAATYLVFFCIGTTAGMASMSVLFALPAWLGAAHTIRLERALRVTASVASIGIGLSIAHRVGIQDGLFAAAPSAMP